jgi:hypothetical protein
MKGGHYRWSENNRTILAHRRAWEEANGPIPEGWQWVIHHTCENPACVNVEHLELKTRGGHTTLHKMQEKTCKRGHEFTEEDRRRGKGCLICRREEGRRQWAEISADPVRRLAYNAKRREHYKRKEPA